MPIAAYSEWTETFGERKSVFPKELARLICCSILILGDVLALGVAFLCANLIYLGRLDAEHGVVMLGVLTPIYVGIAALNRGYAALVLECASASVVRSLQGLIIAAAAVLFVAYFLKAGSSFSRAVFAIGLTGSFLLIPASRLLLRKLIFSLLGGTPYMTVVIRDGVPYKDEPHDIVITTAELNFNPETSDPFHYDRLAQAVKHADRLIIACAPEHYEAWSTVLKSMRIKGELLVGDSDRIGIIGIGNHGDRRTMVVAAGGLNLRDRIIKRAFDVIVSISSLVALSPLLILVAIAIRLESPGSALFRQDRIGRDNKIFRLYKFRSMYIHMSDPAAEKLTLKNDARVTKVGEFIRRTSIDELPQLLNVLKGDMSMVGPRPHAIAAKAANVLYWDIDPRYRHRHSMKPGVTGLAQVRGFRGATDRCEDLTNRLTADLEYSNQWSIWRDMWIILQTMKVLRHDNAF